MTKQKLGMALGLLLLFLVGWWRHFYVPEPLITSHRTIKVHLSGAIRKEGVYELDENDRLQELIEAGGGLSEEADSDRLNLARLLLDGERIHIEERVTPSLLEEKKTSSLPRDAFFWESVPGIGPKLAADIIQYLEEHPAARLEDLQQVSGIGSKKMQDILNFFEKKEGL